MPPEAPQAPMNYNHWGSKKSFVYVMMHQKIYSSAKKASKLFSFLFKREFVLCFRSPACTGPKLLHQLDVFVAFLMFVFVFIIIFVIAGQTHLHIQGGQTTGNDDIGGDDNDDGGYGDDGDDGGYEVDDDNKVTNPPGNNPMVVGGRS